MLARRLLLGTALVGLGLGLALPQAQADDVTLRVFMGGQQRPDVFDPLFRSFEAQNPGVRVELEIGGATSDVQQQYLTTVLTSQDDALDIILIDVIRPAQYAAAGWAEPLDKFMTDEEKDELLARYLPVYGEANQVDGQLIALPGYADAMYIYYRSDLLEKYDLEPPTTWIELMTAAEIVQEGEDNPRLQGLSIQGAPIEGANCTFLVPFWGAGGELHDADGNLQIDSDAGRQAFELWLDAKERGVVPRNVAEVATDDTRQAFQGGNVVFALLWGYGWAHFQSGDSEVAGNVGVTRVPAFEGGEHATCIGGWQWAMSAFSANKDEAWELLRFLAGPESGKAQAIHASHLPVLLELYQDEEVLAANPWFADAQPVVETARARPVSPRYPEVSDIIRSNVNAVLAEIKSPDDALAEMQARLARTLR